jgi:hypothetical protein
MIKNPNAKLIVCFLAICDKKLQITILWILKKNKKNCIPNPPESP